MVNRRGFLRNLGLGTALLAFSSLGLLVREVLAQGMEQTIRVFSALKGGYVNMDRIEKTAREWKKILTPEQFHVLRDKGTERAFTGALWDNKKPGIYRCAACELDLFSSEHKYDSGTGWPSFWQPIAPENIQTEDDWGFFTRRTEVHCARCGGHQGHIFEDGPKPTGLRYCINSVSLKFVETGEK